MVSLAALWLPILLSAVFVFIASSIIHMLLPFHKNEYNKLPNQDKVLEAMRGGALSRGEYMFPRGESLEDCKTPEMQEKYRQGPVGFMTILPSQPPAMGKPLVLWFIFSLIISLLTAYVARVTLPAGMEYLTVFRVTGTVSFMAYAVAHFSNCIWKGLPWSSGIKHAFDGLIYGLVTAGAFGWLWPS